MKPIQKFTNKTSLVLVGGGALSIALCSGLLWLNLAQQPSESQASPDFNTPPVLEFELSEFQTTDTVQSRIAQYKFRKPLRSKENVSVSLEKLEDDE